MIARILSVLFPPKLGKIENIDTVVLAAAIRNGEAEVYEGEDSWAGPVFEWRDGWHLKSRRYQ
jgi:hypothetical protein